MEGASRATLANATGTINKHKRPLPGHQTTKRRPRCHRRPRVRASPRSIPPIPQRNARLARPRLRRGRCPPQYSAPARAAGAAGAEGAAHKSSRRARPLSRRVATMASRRCCAIELATRAAPPGSFAWAALHLPGLGIDCFLVRMSRRTRIRAAEPSRVTEVSLYHCTPARVRPKKKFSMLSKSERELRHHTCLLPPQPSSEPDFL